MNIELIHRYFPGLPELQQEQFMQLGVLYPEWNARINVISRKDIENLYERHILHSLGIAKVIRFTPGTTVLDAGTGGGFPGVPLAILFPETRFHLVDSTAKKLTVVEAIAKETGLKNITTEHCRFEDHIKKYDFVISRAVASLELIERQLFKNVAGKEINDIPNGILYLKGGEIQDELSTLQRDYKIYDLDLFFTEEFFLTKKLIHIF